MISQTSTARAARLRLRKLADPRLASFLQRFFKTGPGQYGEGDRFLGIKVPPLRKVAKEFSAMPAREIDQLLRSAMHEERLLALMILVMQYRDGDAKERERVYRHYLRRTRYVSNWDLVDGSAEYILGPHCIDGDHSCLRQLLVSPRWWERRIAVLATFHFIRQ